MKNKKYRLHALDPLNSGYLIIFAFHFATIFWILSKLFSGPLSNFRLDARRDAHRRAKLANLKEYFSKTTWFEQGHPLKNNMDCSIML